MLSLVLALVALGWGIGPVQAEEKVYVNGIDANFPPFAYIDKDGKPAGFDVEALDWIAQEMGFKVKHVAIDWDASFPASPTERLISSPRG